MNGLRQRHEARRREIIELLRCTMTIREIAEYIGKSQKVVRWHIKVMRKCHS